MTFFMYGTWRQAALALALVVPGERIPLQTLESALKLQYSHCLLTLTTESVKMK